MALQLGIIGAGYMGTLHAKNLMTDGRVKIIGVGDVVTSKAEALAQLVEGRTFPSAEALLDAGVEAVYVCTPNTLHTEAVLTALQRNVHVFSEKPMATTLHEATQILDAAHASGAHYQIGHNRRFAPVYKFARQKILEGFGPTSANVKMNRGELKHPAWVADTRVTGGFLYESTVHLLDMMRWLLGEVVDVECRARSSIYNELDDFIMLLTCANGQHCAFSSCAHTSWVRLPVASASMCLANIRQRTKLGNLHLNRMVSGWSFGQLQEFTAYKSRRVGLGVEWKNPYRSSQDCSKCGPWYSSR